MSAPLRGPYCGYVWKDPLGILSSHGYFGLHQCRMAHRKPRTQIGTRWHRCWECKRWHMERIALSPTPPSD